MGRTGKLVGIAVVVVFVSALVAPMVFAVPGVPAADRLVRNKLRTTIVTFTFSEQPLEDAIDFLSTLGSINIVLDKRKVEEGLTVTLKLSNVMLETGLKLVTEQVELKWVVKDGVVYISDEEGTKQEPITVVYPVGDLLAVPPDYEGPTFDLSTLSENTGSGSGGGGGGGRGIFDDTDDDEGTESETRAELLEQLVDLIRTTIAPGTWDEGD